MLRYAEMRERQKGKKKKKKGEKEALADKDTLRTGRRGTADAATGRAGAREAFNGLAP